LGVQGLRVRDQGLGFCIWGLGFEIFGAWGLRLGLCARGVSEDADAVHAGEVAPAAADGELQKLRLAVHLPRDGGVGSCGKGQSLSPTLSFGEIAWFRARGEIRRCDWLERTHSLEIHTGHIQKKLAFWDQS